MRFRISKKVYADKILLLIAGIVLLVFNAASIGTDYFLSNIHLLLAGVCCMVGGIYLLAKPLLLEYDLDHLYVTRGNRTQQISLYNIIAIKKGAFSMNGPTYWKILFMNQEGRKRMVYFVPYSTLLNEFKEFQFRVQAANPDVSIETW